MTGAANYISNQAGVDPAFFIASKRRAALCSYRHEAPCMALSGSQTGRYMPATMKTAYRGLFTPCKTDPAHDDQTRRETMPGSIVLHSILRPKERLLEHEGISV